MKNPSLVNAKWLQTHLEDPELIVLDTTLAKPKASTSDIEHHDLQIPGARFFDIDHAFSDRSVDLPHMMCDPQQFQKEAQKLGINANSTVVVYDPHGVYSSPRAWWMLKSMGHEHVTLLDGGLPDWIHSGYATEPKQTVAIDQGNFQANFNATCFVNSSYVLETIGQQKVQVLDARSRGRFEATEPEPRAGLRGGHIPNSISLPFTEVLDGTKMKNHGDLKALFQSLLLQDQRLVCSCGSGLTAGIILFAAHLVGLESLAIYDGSWTEWGGDTALPVSTN